ncbi:MAG: ABC transporter ATP-binding protein [Roseiarcus sp.]|jgi:simple sugar transport system ATP-binding protein
MTGAFSLEAAGMSKRFGALAALDDVSLRVDAGSVHALLGENGAGKSTLVKCIMGFYHADEGSLLLDSREEDVRNPRDAARFGLGMVYQHFTLAPSLTVLENLVMARADAPAPLDAPVHGLAAGEKQKAEILKQLYLGARFLILDEPTSMLTPQEADQMLGTIRDMARENRLTALLITHKFREVLAYADAVTVLRKGRLAGTGKVVDLTVDKMAAMMIGEDRPAAPVARADVAPSAVRLAIEDLKADDADGAEAVRGVTLAVRAGEIVGIAGVSGNGQSELVEVLAGQRDATGGRMLVEGEVYFARRAETQRHRLALLPEEPLRNACVGRMSVAENMAMRNFDRPPMANGFWLSARAMREAARGLIERYRVKTPGPDAPIASLSGGNVQRAVLARELGSEVCILVAANPVFGLDFAAVADIHGQIVAARNRGAAVLLVSEDLDELLDLSDRLVVMSEGHIVLETTAATADRTAIGRAMAGH